MGRSNAANLELPGDVAPLPDGWEYQPLGTLIDKSRGISYGVVQPGTQNPLGIPIIRVNNLRHGQILTEDLRRVDPEIESQYERTRLRGGEVLLSLVGTLGETAIVPDELIGWNVARAVAVIPVLPEVEGRWINLCLRSPQVQHYIHTWATTTVQATFNLRDAARLPIPMPPRDEREAIAHILGTLDDKIELNQQMNQTLEAIARALFKSWFIDFDPVRAKMDGRQPADMDAETAALFPDEFGDSPLGKIPKGWKVQKLIEITSKIGSGATPRGGSQVYVDEGISLIRSQNVYDYQFSWDGLAQITEETAEQLRNVVVEPNDILLNITGDSILRTCVVEPAVLPARVNQHVSIIRAIPEIPCRYLHLHLVQSRMKNFLLGFDTGGTRKAVTKGQLESVPILLPPASVLFCFKKLTDSIFEHINSNLAESRTLVEVRNSLLPKLLSGQVRVGL